MKPTPVGVDIAKNVFQIHYIHPETGVVVNKPIKRAAFLLHFSKREPCLIGMEACGSSQHWARSLMKLGHEVRLLAPRFVKAFNVGNKNDAADAQAIWLAVQQVGKSVAVKTETQQAILALHRFRQQLIKFRTMRVNCIRGLLGEYGEVMPQGRAAFNAGLPVALERLVDRLPALLIDTIRELWGELARYDDQIARVEGRLQQWLIEDDKVRAIAAIPGVGLLTATAAVATIGDIRTFRSGREFSAWLGLVPRQVGSGGKTTLMGISKRGDVYLRTLLVHCAWAIYVHAKSRSPWVEQLARRRPVNIVIVAMANKIARTIWAVLAHGKPYVPGFVSIKPA